MKTHLKIKSLLVAGCATGALFAPQVTLAQADTAQEAAANAADVPDIVVTGSRVITNGNESPTPLTVVTVEQLAATTPSNPSDALNKLPVFANSQSAASPGSANANLTGNFLNLRGVGPIRTLILFDGHRVPSTSQDGTVDVNTLPQSLLQRVDVVTGGASAVYGSDAITGVVNFVINRNFNGLQVSGQSGISSRGDAQSYRGTLTYGTPLFDGRGHFEASYDYYRNKGLPSKLSRKLGREVWGQFGNGTTASPFVASPNSRFPGFPYGGSFFFGPAGGVEFTGNGGTRPASPDNDGFLSNSRLVASLETHQAFARFDYDLSDNLHFYAQGGYSRSRNEGDIFNFSYLGTAIASDNPFLPASLQVPGAGAFPFAKISQTVPAQALLAISQSIYINTGVSGSLADGVDFDLSYTHGDSKQNVINRNNPNNGRFAAALDSVRDPASGQIVCGVTLTNPGLYPGCVPLDPFGPSSESAAAVSYVLEDTSIRNRNKMDDILVTVSGSPFSLPAGDVKVALSGEYRHMSLGIDSQYDQEVTLDCTGLRFNCTPGITSEFGGSQTNDAQASLNVKEVALEVNVPLLRDVAVAQALNLNGAVRYADYSTSGSAWTWKVGLDWHLTNALRLRATRSRDFRAPTLYDLFAPPSSIVFNFTDIHTNNTTAVTMNETRGNPDLKAEVANTLTAGLVYDVPFVPGLSFSVDYYKIKLNNAIGSIGPDQETQQQCEASNGTSPLCDLFIRPFPFSNTTSANFPTKVLNQSLNLASLQVEGVDAELNFRKDVGPGTLTLRALVNYQPDYVTQRFTGTRIINEAGGPNRSKWRATGLFAYDLASYSIAVQQRWRSAQRPFTDPLVVSSGIGAIKAVAYTDLTFTARVGEKDRFSFFLSAQNLFDKDPPLYPGAAGATPGFFYPTVNGDDVIGRYFTAGFKANF